MTCPNNTQIKLVEKDKDLWDKFEYLCNVWWEYYLDHPATTKVPPWMSGISKDLKFLDSFTYDELNYFYDPPTDDDDE